MATHLLANGKRKTVRPKDRKEFSLAEMQGFVGGYIEAVAVPGGTLYVNEDGIPKGLPVNHNASDIAGQRILGDAILVDGEGL